MSPEQLRGEPMDPRSNMFSLGAILYEMVTERKAFPGDDADQVRQQILEQMPVPPSEVNRKLHPALSDVIVKALAKSPADRYQNGQELVNDLEKCKESPAKVTAKKPTAPIATPTAPQAQKAAPPAAPPRTSSPQVSKPAPERKPATAPVMRTAAPQPKPVALKAENKTENEFAVTPAPPAAEPVEAASLKPVEADPADAPAVPAWRAAAAGVGSSSTDLPRTPKLDSSEQFISTCVKASIEAASHETATMSAAAVKPEPVPPKIAVDPMMEQASESSGTRGPSFSEITELPPLKEVYVPPPPPPEPEPVQSESAPALTTRTTPAEKRVPTQQVAKQAARKAVTEIKKTPPKLFMYSIAAAVGVILLVVVAIAYHIRSENEDDNQPTQAAVPASSAQSQAATQPAPVTQAPAPAPAPVETEPVQPARRAPVSVIPRYKQKKSKPTVASAVVVPGQLTINSTPEGAAISLDDRHDPTWVTPFNVSGLLPGQHLVKVSKAGFSTETRSIEVTSGGKSFIVIQLAQLTAAISVTSDPAGAAVFMDGKDTGRLTPTQISVDKPGQHALTVKKQGYLDESTTANLQPGQLLHFSPALKALGNTDDIKIGGGKLKKIFGGGGDTTGMGEVSVKTTPKGAQVAVNNRILDKLSPLDFHLNPGTYVIDITASGFKDIHRVINVEKGGKVAIDENMDRE
jgi:PEGA domain